MMKNSFDEFIFKYRYYIGAVLVFIILAGTGLVIFGDYIQKEVVRDKKMVAGLKTENEKLRQELSAKASSEVVQSSTQNQGDKININTASLAELDKLPGVGPVRAGDIISYREKNSGFKTIEDIKNIKGIGDVSFEKIKDLITIGN
ncbi:MAG: helix-hairpin-helix domain-containing protein [Candidatus Berkelbacteria bacterium]